MQKYGDLSTTHTDITGLAGGGKAESKGDNVAKAPAAPPAAPAPPMGKK